MKRKIRVLRILILDFYTAYKNKILAAIEASFMIIVAIILAIFSYKYLEPKNFLEDELNYLEEKVTKIVTSDINSISNIVKEMEEKGYLTDISYKYQIITIERKEGEEKVYFSYSSPTIQKRVDISDAKDFQNLFTFLTIIVGAIIGMVICIGIEFIFVCIRFIFVCINKIKNRYKNVLEKVDLQSGKKLGSEEEMQCIEKKICMIKKEFFVLKVR